MWLYFQQRYTVMKSVILLHKWPKRRFHVMVAVIPLVKEKTKFCFLNLFMFFDWLIHGRVFWKVKVTMSKNSNFSLTTLAISFPACYFLKLIPDLLLWSINFSTVGKFFWNNPVLYQTAAKNTPIYPKASSNTLKCFVNGFKDFGEVLGCLI